METPSNLVNHTGTVRALRKRNPPTHKGTVRKFDPMRRIAISVLVLLVAVIGAALVIPALIPEETLRTRAEAAASDALGRQVALPGRIQLRLLPNAQITAGQAIIENADGFGSEPFAEMSELRVSVALLPLISRQIDVQEFVLVDPVIRLQSQGGANNWTLGNPSEGAPDTASGASSGTGFVRQPGALPLQASFGDVRLVNGSVIFDDGNQVRRIEALDLNVSLPSVDEPVRLNGGFNADGRPMSFDVSLGSLRGFFEGAETAMSAELTGALADIVFEGRFLESETLAYDGDVDMTLPLRALGRYLGADLPEGDVFQSFSADARISGSPGELSLSDARITLDEIVTTGELALNYDRVRPLITGSVQTGQLDITPYIPADDASANRSGSGGGIGPWSEEELDLSPLQTVDAVISAQASQFKVRDIEAEDVSISLNLDNGRLVADLRELGLYGGGGRVTAVVNARSARPSYSLDATVDALDALPFLTAAAGFDRLAGIGNMQLDLNASGASPAAIMNSLSGSGAFDFSDGAIVGVNLAQVIRTIQQALTTGSIPSGFADAQQTDFSALTGTFSVENGRAENLDLAMLSPLLRVEGLGSINMAEQQIDYRLTPRAVSALTGQGGDLNLQGVGVPVVLSGGFNNVSVSIDFASVARDIARAQAGNLLGGDLGNRLRDGGSLEDAARDAAGDALRRAIDRNTAGNDEEETDPGRQLLRNLLNRGRDGSQDDEEGEGEDDGEDDSEGGGN